MGFNDFLKIRSSDPAVHLHFFSLLSLTAPAAATLPLNGGAWHATASRVRRCGRVWLGGYGDETMITFKQETNRWVKRVDQTSCCSPQTLWIHLNCKSLRCIQFWLKRKEGELKQHANAFRADDSSRFKRWGIWSVFAFALSFFASADLWERGWLIVQSIYCQINKQLKQLEQWRNEAMNEWTNERMNEWMNAWMHECMNAWMHEWMHECMNEWMNEWMHAWLNQLIY